MITNLITDHPFYPESYPQYKGSKKEKSVIIAIGGVGALDAKKYKSQIWISFLAERFFKGVYGNSGNNPNMT